MAAPDLENYVEVHDRIKAFYEKYPEGSLQGRWHVQKVGDDTLIVYRAEALRTPDDKAPAVGHASEPYPGQTPYTRSSELMNAETSAWGRALAALGFEVNRGIASANEVRAREGGRKLEGDATASQKRAITTILNKAGIAKDFQAKIVHAVAGDPPSKQGASEILDLIASTNTDAERDEAVKALIKRSGVMPPTDVPAETEGLPDLHLPANDEANWIGDKH